MKFMHRNLRFLTIASVLAFLLAGSVTPASAIYNPHTGRWMQRDPNGVGVVLQPSLSYEARNPVITVSLAYELQYADGMNFYEYLRSDAVNHNDPSGMFTYSDVLITAGLAGGLYGLASSYAHFSDRGSNWKLAASFGMGAGMGTFTAMGFGLLSGAFASAAGVSIGVASTSIGLMTTPALFGKAMYDYQSAETYADRLMAQIDVGLAVSGMVASHVALFKVANPGTVSVLEKVAARALRRVGIGKGPVYGTRAHTQFANEVRGLGKQLTPEVSYYGGRPSRYGLKGSIRVDVVEGPIERPIAIYDLKTGGSKLTPARITEIRSHLPRGYKDIPITEIRGDR